MDDEYIDECEFISTKRRKRKKESKKETNWRAIYIYEPVDRPYTPFAYGRYYTHGEIVSLYAHAVSHAGNYGFALGFALIIIIN